MAFARRQEGVVDLGECSFPAAGTQVGRHAVSLALITVIRAVTAGWIYSAGGTLGDRDAFGDAFTTPTVDLIEDRTKRSCIVTLVACQDSRMFAESRAWVNTD